MTSTDTERPVWGGRWEALRSVPNKAGGQGQVWAVRDRSTGSGRSFALKLLHPGAKFAKLQRFAREVETPKQLQASVTGIVEIVDAHVADSPGAPSYYVMPWSKSTLKDAIPFLQGAEGLERTLRLAEQVARALAYCHSATPQVIHRDVKPASILLSEDAQVPILADFGICFLDDHDRLTRTEGETVGSEGFTAPELFGGGPVDEVGPAADIYSLGKTIYNVVSGGNLFPLDRHRHDRWFLARDGADPRLGHLHGLLDRMVCEAVEERYGSMTECADHIARAIESIRAGVPYTEGMYSVGHRAGMHMREIRVALRRPNEATRHRAFSLGVEQAVAHAKQEAAGGPALPVFRQFRGALEYHVPANRRDVVARVADTLLAPVGALFTSEDPARDLVQEWSHRVAQEALEDPRESPDHYFAAGAVVAFHVAGAFAWRLGLMEAVGELIQAHGPRARAWNHPQVFDQASIGILQVSAHVSEHSAALANFTTEQRTSMRDATAVYSGLQLLRDFQTSGEDVQPALT
jgi:hypothetical protein